MKRLLWQDGDDSHKYTLVKWEEVCQHVDQGGLGLVGLGIMNVCVLSKWLWILEKEEVKDRKILRTIIVVISLLMLKANQDIFMHGILVV